jgi:hypothetical protein
MNRLDFIKKNWEKVLLGGVLLGLLVAVVMLPVKIASEKAELDEMMIRIVQRPAKEIEPLDLSAFEKTLERTGQRVALDLTTGHRLFNPVLWQRATDGRPIKVMEGNEVGIGAVEVVQITPLHLVLTLDSVLTTDSGSRYAIGVEKQADPVRRNRVKRQTYASVGDKNDTFLLREVVGAPADPTAVILELSDTSERVTLTREKPFTRVDGYTADLRYPPENRNFAGRRVDDSLTIARETYKIVAITKSDVVFSAPSGKKTTLTLPSAAADKR